MFRDIVVSRLLCIGFVGAGPDFMTFVLLCYDLFRLQLVSFEEKEKLLRKYWTISPRQTETSVVLVSPDWRK